MTVLLTAWGLIQRIPREVWLILAALAALWAYGAHKEAQGRAEGKAEVQAKWDKAKKAAETVQAKSAGQATIERVIETRTITIKQKARDNAIQATDDDKPSAASNALNCERLRAAGTDIAGLPACRGRSDGAETPAQP